jgi:hypothetical protein
MTKKKKSIKVFNFVAKRVHKLSKKQGLGFSWQESQKFTSTNIFKQFKGKPVSKIKVTDIDKATNAFLLSQKQGAEAEASQVQKQKEVCASPFLIPSKDLEPINWWGMPEIINSFDPFLNISVEFDGILNTGITKKMNVPDMVSVRESFRKMQFSSEITIIFKILKIPNKKDDKDPCSYYVLVTVEGSAEDESTSDAEIDNFMLENQLPAEIQAQRQAKKDEAEKAKHKTKKGVKAMQRPQQVEAKPSTDGEKIKIEAERYKQLNITLDGLREDFKLKLITKKQYQDRQKIILSKFEKGGQV